MGSYVVALGLWWTLPSTWLAWKCTPMQRVEVGSSNLLGSVRLSFRDKDQKASMHRLDPVLLELDQDPEANQEEISAREAQLQAADVHTGCA